MTVRTVTPASGALSMSFAWGDGTEILQAGQLIDVDPGSALETAIRAGEHDAAVRPAARHGGQRRCRGGVELMALSRYVLTSTVTVPAGTPATPAAGEPGTGGAAGYGNASISAGAVLWPTTFIVGTTIVLDSASPLHLAER